MANAAALLFVVLLLAACGSRALTRHGLPVDVVRGASFDHFVVHNGAPLRDGDLRVYVDGDGVPFSRRDRVAADPSPRRALMLDLMVRDSNAAVYVSRPCYFGLDGPPCDMRHWTTARYGEAVVESLVRAVDAVAAAQGARTLTLVGHSGGGALAVLMAARLDSVVRVVTLAGNMDPEGWAELMGYSPLAESLSPLESDLDDAVTELHVVALSDKVVPPASIDRFLDRREGRPRVTICYLPGCGHANCFKKRWTRAAKTLHQPDGACAALAAGR